MRTSAAFLLRAGLTRILHTIDQLMKQYRPSLVVVDSFKALHPFAS